MLFVSQATREHEVLQKHRDELFHMIISLPSTKYTYSSKLGLPDLKKEPFGAKIL